MVTTFPHGKQYPTHGDKVGLLGYYIIVRR
nr:MAG TPA: hypothetical protein [Caudoviricetes sp.]